MIEVYSSILPSKTACIVLNGVIKDYDVIRGIISSKKYGIIIGVDGGANHLHNMGIRPHYIIGDLDSVDEKIKEDFNNIGVEFKKFPTKKNETDFELATILASELGVLSMDIYACTGGRIDHEIANIFMLDYIQRMGIYPRIITETNEIYLLENDELTLQGKKGDIVSIIPMKGNARGVTLKDFEYELEEFEMEFATPRGISNVMLEDEVHIDVHDGCLLIIRNKI